MKTNLMISATLLVGVALLGGCKSNDPTTGTTPVSGQVVVYQTQQAVPHATVQVYHLSSGGGYVPVGSGYPTDALGKFRFSFQADNKTGYIAYATAPPGYLTDWALAPHLTAGRDNNGVVVPTYAPAWVKHQLVDEPPKSRVSIYLSGYEGNGDRLNYPRDTTLIRPTFAGKTGISWSITDEKGNTTSYSQNITLSALDTVKVRIPF